MCRRGRLSTFDDALTQIRKEARKPDNFNFQSFKKLNGSPSQRWSIAKHFAETSCQVVGVVIHKPSLAEEGWQDDKEGLYFKASQFLSERISWACRDTHSVRNEANPTCEIVFSERGHLRYENFRDFLRKLQSNPVGFSCNADWNHLSPDAVGSRPQDDTNSAMLAVDHFASGLGCSIEKGIFGQFDDRYARIWSKRYYNNNGRVMGNGLKIWPNEGISILQKEPLGSWIKQSFIK